MSKRRDRQAKVAERLQNELLNRWCWGRQVGGRPTQSIMSELVRLEDACGGLPVYVVHDGMLRAGLGRFLIREESQQEKSPSARETVCPRGVCSSALTWFRHGDIEKAKRVLALESDKTWAYPEFRFFVHRFIFGDRIRDSII